MKESEEFTLTTRREHTTSTGGCRITDILLQWDWDRGLVQLPHVDVDKPKGQVHAPSLLGCPCWDTLPSSIPTTSPCCPVLVCPAATAVPGSREPFTLSATCTDSCSSMACGDAVWQGDARLKVCYSRPSMRGDVHLEWECRLRGVALPLATHGMHLASIVWQGRASLSPAARASLFLSIEIAQQTC